MPPGIAPDNHGPIQFLRTNRPYGEPGCGQDFGGARCLPLTGFDKQLALRSQPVNNTNSNPTVKVQAIRTAVKGNRGFIKACFRRHGTDGFRGHIRSIYSQHLDPAMQRIWKSLKQIARMHVAAQGIQVPPGTPHRCLLNICRMQLHPRGLAKNCSSHGTGTATEVHHNRGCRQRTAPQQCKRLVDQQPGATPWHENARFNRNPTAGELRPTQDMLQGNARHPAPDIVRKFRGTEVLSQQEPGFLFSENTTHRPQH